MQTAGYYRARHVQIGATGGEETTQEALDKVLELHKKWEKNEPEGKRAVLSHESLVGKKLCGADLRHIDFCNTDLRHADFRGANIDYSAFTLCCGGLCVHIDDRIAIQLLYHLVRNVLYSKNTSEELKSLLGQKDIVRVANQFHRVDECGRIEVTE